MSVPNTFSAGMCLKSKLSSGEPVLGMQLRSRSPLIAELAGCLGFDYVYIETEHFPCNDETVENLVRAAQLTGAVPWIRVTDTSPENVGHMLDIGIQGIIVPHMETAEQAESLKNAVKFPPLGSRGSALTSRAAWFGGMEGAAFRNASNETCLAIGMIETMKAVEIMDAILD